MRHALLAAMLSVAILCIGTPAQGLADESSTAVGYEPDPDPVQGLHAFMERQGRKPFDLYQEGRELRTHRVMFEDRRFGTTVWMLDDSPTTEHAGTASIWSAWNINASALYVEGVRTLDDEPQRGWFFNADYSRLIPAHGGRPAVWAPEDPELYYSPHSPFDKVTRNNWRTGEQEVVAEWSHFAWPNATARIYGLTEDERHIFIDLPNRGIFVPFENDENYPVPAMPLYDGRPIGPDGPSVLLWHQHGGANHMPVVYNHQQHGDLIALRTGMLVDRQTGEKNLIAAPLCGNTNYLRAFHEGRVKYPQGDEWTIYRLDRFMDGVSLPTDMSMEELYALWRNLPHATHGHESGDPDREFIAVDGGTTRIFRVRDGQERSIKLSPDGTNYHLHWRHHPRYFVGWVRGWHFGSYRRPVNANVEFQVFSDGTFQPIVDTKHRFNAYYAGGDFSMFSPDATKIHYGSSMTGRFKNYIAVVARPRPPIDPSWRVENDGVTIIWQPSTYSRETKGYLVYRSRTSGHGYTLVTPEPVEDTHWHDETVQPGRAYYYVVTSLEHSGLESGYSAEVARAGVQLPEEYDGTLTVYAEAEQAVWDLETDALPGLTIGVDRREASDWYYLYRHPESDRGQAGLTIDVPADGLYHLWARVRSGQPERTRWQIGEADTPREVATDATEWTWVRVEENPLALLAGRTEVTLATGDASAQLDLLCLTTDASMTPQGTRPEDQPRPSAVAQLRAANVQPRVNRLTWRHTNEPGLSHYHVYASREPIAELSQELRIGSPTEAVFIDWGLRADTRYHYAVTAVNRRGDESPIALAEASTLPAETSPVEIELAFGEAELTGAFERSSAGGTRAADYVVPEEPDTNSAAWTIEVPEDDAYYFWLRYLLRGTGARGPSVDHRVEVLLNGQPLTTLGDGRTDLNIPDELIAADHPLAPQVWTWAWPGRANLEGIRLPAGRHTLTLRNLDGSIRYDVLLITNEPSFVPEDGRLRQN